MINLLLDQRSSSTYAARMLSRINSPPRVNGSVSPCSDRYPSLIPVIYYVTFRNVHGQYDQQHRSIGIDNSCSTWSKKINFFSGTNT